jgi:hypothetical protein
MITRTASSPFVILGFLAIFALSLATCTTSEASPVTGTVTITNSLGMGGSEDGIIVHLLEVVNDSRCAAGVTCVDPGKADVRIGYTIGNGARQETVLEMRGSQPVRFRPNDRFLIELLRLLPDPPPVGGVQQGDYQLEVRISED